jgi:hypothetical protein
VDAIDLLGLLEAIFNLVEKRFGKVVAWIVTITLTVGSIAVLVAIFLRFMF